MAAVLIALLCLIASCSDGLTTSYFGGIRKCIAAAGFDIHSQDSDPGQAAALERCVQDAGPLPLPSSLELRKTLEASALSDGDRVFIVAAVECLQDQGLEVAVERTGGVMEILPVTPESFPMQVFESCVNDALTVEDAYLNTKGS